jgi:KDO2-lipid IV(A) lauroyltransferase
MRHPVRHVVEYASLRVVVFLLGLLPLRAALACGAALGTAAWLLRVRREVVRANLSQAFPGITERGADRIGLASFRNTGRFMVEFARQDRLGADHVLRHVRIENRAALDRLCREGGIGLAFHFGNWELLGMIVKECGGGSTSLLVGDQHNRLVDGFINRLRATPGIGLIRRDGAMREIFRSIRSGGCVCWLSDQNAGRAGLMVDFFSRPASTPRGAAAIAMKLGCGIYPSFLVRDGAGPGQTAVFSDPIFPVEGASGEEAERDLTRRYTACLEEMIRRRPDLYWWPHRRWKVSGLYPRGREGAADVR